MTTRPRIPSTARLASLPLAVSLIACTGWLTAGCETSTDPADGAGSGSTGSGSTGSGPGQVATDPSADFSDIDGFILQAALVAGELVAIDPRTGATSDVHTVSGQLFPAGIAPSPDGLHFAFLSGTSPDATLEIWRFGSAAGRPTLTEVHTLQLTGVAVTTELSFDPSGTWVYSDLFAVEVATGAQVGCERALGVMPLPDGHHLLMSCVAGSGGGGGGTHLYRDGVPVARPAGVPVATGEHGVIRAMVSADGQWILNTEPFAGARSVLHVPTRTVYAAPALLGVDSTTLVGQDLSGRLVLPPFGTLGTTCQGATLPPQGELVDAAGVLAGSGDVLRTPIPLNHEGTFLDLDQYEPPDPWSVPGLVVTPWGLDADGSHALFAGIASWNFPLREFCRDEPFALHVRRLPLDPAGPPIDSAYPIDWFSNSEPLCTPSRHELRYPWSRPTSALSRFGGLILPGPGEALVCAGRNGSFQLGPEGITPLLAAAVLSPGRRASAAPDKLQGLEPSTALACQQRLDTPTKAACYGDKASNALREFVLWGGWAATGGGGHAGPAVYRLSHVGATPGTPVTVFGSGFGTSGTLKLGAYAVPTGEITSWTDTRIVFTMPSDAPTRPSAVSAGVGPTVAARTLFRSEAWTPAFAVPDHLVAPYGTLFIPIDGADSTGATLAWQALDQVNPGQPPGGWRAVEGGVTVDIDQQVPPGSYLVTLTLGAQTRTVTVEVDGSFGGLGDAWVRIEPNIFSVYATTDERLFDAPGGVVALYDEPLLVQAEGPALPLTNPETLTTGTWATGPFDPYVIRDGGLLEQLVGFDIGPDTATALFQPVTTLDAAVTADMAAALSNPYKYGWSLLVSEAASLGAVLTSQDDPGCAPFPCAADWSFDLATGAGTPLPVIDRSWGTVPLGTTAGGLHFKDSNTLLTLSADVADFGTLRPDATLEGDAWARVRALTGGYLRLDAQWRTVAYGDRANAAAGWTDLGLVDAVTLGTDRAGTTALVGTASGEVFLIDAATPTLPVSLGTIPNHEVSVQAVDKSWIRITQEGIAVWLLPGGPSVFFMRRLPE